MAIDYKFLFKNGEIGDWYLRDDQLALYNLLGISNKLVTVIHRRFGKTSTHFAYIFEQCLIEETPVRYGAPTLKMATEIFNTITDHIFINCPEIKPRHSIAEGGYVFEDTGSIIRLFGGKDSSEIDKAGRGGEAKIIYVDEFGFFKHKPEYLIKSVLSPQLDTFGTEGQLFITSTVPEDLTHYFMDEIEDASIKGNLYEWTIDDSLKSGSITPEVHELIIDRCGGIQSDSYQREYKCNRVPPKDKLVIPEASEHNDWVGKQVRPDYFQPRIMMDLGLQDNHVTLFYYVDFVKQRLIIEKEYITNYETTKNIAEKLKEIEKELGYKKPVRFGDNQLQQLFDLCHSYQYDVFPIVKAVKGEQSSDGWVNSTINELRIGTRQRKILIDPDGCPSLVRQMKYGIWKVNAEGQRVDFQRTKEFGHLDALKALTYAYYLAEWQHNPYPDIPEFDKDGKKITSHTHAFNAEYLAELKKKKSFKSII